MSTDLNEWGESAVPEQEKRLVTIEDLDQAVRNVASARKDYNDKKKISDEAEKQKENAEKELIDLMVSAGKTSYKLDSIGTISVFDKYAISNPSDPEDKRTFFNWINEKYGQDGLDKYQVTNYNAINALYNEYAEECKVTGEDPSIPGLGFPTARKVLRIIGAK